MKTILISMLIVFSLNAGIFNYYQEEKKSIHLKYDFIEAISNANAVIKKGSYERFAKYKNGIQSTIKHVDKLDITKAEKIELKNDLQTYANIINRMYKQLHVQAPEFNKHYTNSIKGLKKFNTKLTSIGYRPLLSLWHKLSKTKSKFIKKPSQKLINDFDKNYELMMISITELYLDEEIEEPLLTYLHNYKTHFNEVSTSYQRIGFNNIKSIKPLCYKIKAKMEFLSPIEL